MGWRNALEPRSLLAHARTHPPEGFSVLDKLPAPGFVARFDLLTTADPALKQRIESLPLHARWSRWLRPRTAFVGSTVTEYLPLPAEGLPPEALAAALRAGPGRRCMLAILKDIPQDSPLLSEADNGYAEALAAACRAQGCVLVEGQALAYVPIDFGSVAEYLSRLSRSRRDNLKRKLRSRAGLQIQCIHTGAAFEEDERIHAFYALYLAVYAQSETHFDLLSRDFFAAVLRDADSGGLVFEYRSAASGELLGWNLCYEHAGRLIDKYIGLSYPAAREANLYFVSWIVNLEYALARGLTHYIAGWTDPEVKRSLGARFTWTRHAVYVRNPLLRALARRFASHFESDRAWRDGLGEAA